ncbi:MAG TPA: glycosyltransferase family 39 protein [Candidatus Sulfomarinibacteraceae bacterium]|nr:glycosyltransferase family 39 protein [Candidatus Sulfomarinibacteraceae bacterium]
MRRIFPRQQSVPGPWLPALVVWLAFVLRVWQLEAVPPGWSDDELSNIFVLAQKVFQGNYAVYYPDATGLEAPYHVVSGLALALFGFNAIGIRLLSSILGTLSVALTYRLGRALFGRGVGLLAAALLAVSFWSLIYSRVNLRHIALPVFLLITFIFFWRGVAASRGRQVAAFLWAGLFMGLGFYSYFASRGAPLILLAFLFYLAIADRARLRRLWPGALLTFAVAAVLALPLLITLLQLPGADARVAEVAVPLVAAGEGDFEPLRRHIVITLSMFHADGDGESLYNIPHRPVFGPIGAIFLWSGVLLSAWGVLRPLLARERSRHGPPLRRHAYAFLLLWWLAGLTPGFLSVPPASLGHTIVAQPATYLLAGLPLARLYSRLSRLKRQAMWRAAWPVLLGALVLLGSVAARDLRDYFWRWPQQGYVRFLYHAEMRDVANYVQQEPGLRDFGISGLLAGPWDRLALEVELANAGAGDAAPRWYNAQRALLLRLGDQPARVFSGYPRLPLAYEALHAAPPQAERDGYQLLAVQPGSLPEPQICFENGLCLLQAQYEAGSGHLHLTWEVARPLDLPETPLIAKPPPPDVYTGPRLMVFAHLVDGEEQRLAGDDGMWVDPATLQEGDVFRQRHHLRAPPGSDAGRAIFGLYDPATGQRIQTEDGRTFWELDLREGN